MQPKQLIKSTTGQSALGMLIAGMVMLLFSWISPLPNQVPPTSWVITGTLFLGMSLGLLCAWGFQLSEGSARYEDYQELRKDSWNTLMSATQASIEGRSRRKLAFSLVTRLALHELDDAFVNDLAKLREMNQFVSAGDLSDYQFVLNMIVLRLKGTAPLTAEQETLLKEVIRN